MKKYHVYFQAQHGAFVWHASYRRVVDAREFMKYRRECTDYFTAVSGNRWLIKHDGRIIDAIGW